MILAISLGTNLGKREDNLKHALHLLRERVGDVVACSSFHTTDPVGFKSSNLFLNAVALLECSRPADEVLYLTQQLEKEMGRTQKSTQGGYADRIIDLDLLFYGNIICHTPQLTLPHPCLHQRRFVLEPLSEIAPDYIHPLMGLSCKEMLQQLNEAHIEHVTQSSAEVCEAVNHLLTQLSPSVSTLTLAQFQSLVEHTPNTHLYIVRDELGMPQGMGTLCICPMPTGCKAWVEDVVIEKACRGRGYGKQLLKHLIEKAKQMHVQSINLTSRPERVAANQMYRKLGFHIRETNVYKMQG